MNLTDIRNVYCIGRNYALHIEELGNQRPQEPLVFSKPTHALVHTSGQAIPLPGKQGSLHYEAEVVIQVARPYKEGIEITTAIDAIALGIDMTLRDVQSKLKSAGQPWLRAKGFRNSAIISNRLPLPPSDELLNTSFSLRKNGKLAQEGKLKEMIFSLPDILSYCQTHFGLDKGDLIYTGTPAGVGELDDGDHLQLFWGKDMLGECTIKLD
ncbi:fumarylacetoacetate hydrolase family protein [Mechercharimyces sp. CAU 1602]|uniref:fumarylacetoacetate hydrolase family protein n=1 Tax=Mechercharimyces sp. CAU 1602 TaxID=2973933 RepID=UPI002163D53F|nr:fumarylacetoacetate hydrolase family protein [Mechercharimyces sp. CAU 1602]MCS1352731.1 fumarylacetoacetate hydrolase family protein [Mechercharimyces sp. CAU 1602]